MFVFGGLCHGMRFVLCGMLMQYVNGTPGNARFHILSNTYRIPALNNWIVLYILLSPNVCMKKPVKQTMQKVLFTGFHEKFNRQNIN